MKTIIYIKLTVLIKPINISLVNENPLNIHYQLL